MFEKILVTGDLLPIREAACEGDLDALISLTRHVLAGKHTLQSGEAAFDILHVIFDHKDFYENLPRAWGVYVLCSQAEQLLYREGKKNRKEYLTRSYDYLQWLVKAMLHAPRPMWDYELLEYAITWMKEHAPKLREESTF